MRLSRLHLATRLLALAGLAAALTGCQVIDGTPLYTQVRVIDASPDAPGLDIYQNSVASLYNVGFGTASSYIAIGPGNYTYTADITGTRQQLASAAAPLALGSQYTLLIGNVTANLQMTMLKDQSTPAPTGQVALRFLDQSTRNGPVDLYLLPSGGKLTGITPIISDIRFGNITTYITAPAGTYSIVAVPTGTILANTSSFLFTGAQVEYAGGAARSIILIDQQMVATPGLQVITADDYDPPAS